MVLILDDLLTPFVLAILKAVKQSILLEPLQTSYNNMGHTVCCNNPHQPYPIRASIIARTEGVHHFQERYNDLYLKDQIWAVSGPLWPELNHNSKRATLYGSSVPIPGN